MSLSSFGSFSASGAATLRTPDCSSALGLYVPSVCLFFFTTQNSQARTAKTMARTPKVTVGATIAAMFGPPVVLLERVSLGTVEFPHVGLLLRISSKTLPTTAPGMTGTSGHAAISSCDRQGQVRADWGLGASAWGHFIESSGYCEDLLHSLSSWWYIMIFDLAVLRWSKQTGKPGTGWFFTNALLPPHLQQGAQILLCTKSMKKSAVWWSTAAPVSPFGI